MQLPYNSPGGYLVHVLFSQCVYFPINGPGRPSGKPRYEPQRKLCDVKTLRMMSYICKVKFSGKPTLQLCRTEKHLRCKLCLLLLKLVSNKGLSTDSLPSNCRTLYSGISLILNCEVIKTESSDRW